MKADDLLPLLGANETDAEVVTFANSVPGRTIVDKEEGSVYYTFPDAGLELTFENGQGLASIFFKREGESEEEPIVPYAGELPQDLSFAMSRQSVRDMLGDPSDSGEAKVDLGIQIFPWDKFDCDGFCLHVRYAIGHESINQVTVSLPYNR